MKKLVTFALIAMLFLSPLFQAKVEASDIKGHQMQSELEYWIAKGVIRADSKGNYHPNKAVTRGEFASYITRALDLPVSTKYTFKDMSKNSSLTVEIQNAAGAGILSGYPDGTFRPNEKITRQQMAGMMYKAMRHMQLPANATKFTFKDSKKISPNFVDAVSAAVNLNIIRGDHRKDGVYFNPQDNATIAHAAAFLFRLFAAAEVLKPSEPSTPGTPTVPDVDPEVYKVSTISNGQVVPTTALYRTYEEALAVYNASSSVRAIQKNNKIIKMKSGRAFGSENPKQLTSLYDNSNFRNEVTYIQKGREMKYIGSSADHVIVEVAGSTFYAKQNEVDLVPTELVTGYDYYEVEGGLLVHHTYDNLKKTRGVYTVGPAANTMRNGKRYTSLDGVHFSEVGSNNVITYYPYFQFQSVRQPTSYSAVELEHYIQEILKDREKTGIARYKDATLKSKLVGLGDYLKLMEEQHRVNAMFILAAAIHESDYGMSANAQTKNNIFGIKVFDSSPEMGEMYIHPTYSVDAFISRYMNLNYANPSGAHANGAVPGNKAVGFNVKYASDPNWGSKIAGHMWRIDSFLGKRDMNQAKLAVISYTGTTGVNVRTSPDVTSTNKLFTYKPKDPGHNAAFGYPLVIVDETTGSDGYVWYKVLADINPPAADYGWIRSDLVRKITY
ncbi:N-acetylmuramoyl-L-alanine amidase [Bacillus sp. OxB-1]|uniref:S-layer homology domain-containing protein n=1 Tax=Bacillus sp. (strain OxB-1) TaxID=98228 RepID=UPI000581EB62|nr:S-layer homology domain-containing protein [Bacillus sp. OxB-1]BAQ10094.1 N-acetylmuramoyl-L-alanine amidase [Bacillus sp. OxB-1]